ncbi:MAG: hypothetical protein HC919_06405 [Oscillatoriales cyanobacterium SM2_2_1]|nr:hypothetical protein [Oscillatoriales cyanobacterium SM2_2_1]
MKVQYLLTLVTISVLGGGAFVFANSQSTSSSVQTEKVETIAQNPCAAKNPCASKNPCAAKNPCASKNPCAAKPASNIQAAAKHPKVYTEKGVALDGQDVVAYFTQGKPSQGTKQFTHQWNGATWQFSSASHRDLFAQNPEKYAPQYGGYCAKAASDGNLATTTPTAWEVRGGKLYLNYDASAQAEWKQDTNSKIKRANANWPRILSNDTLFR